MKSVIAVAALAAVASAATTYKPYFPTCSQQKCIGQGQAELFVKLFQGILTHSNTAVGTFPDTMDIMLSDKFQEISDSINSLAGIPLGNVTTPSKALYINETLNAPPDSNINTLFVGVADCNNIIWHWNFEAVGSKQYPVKGFNLFSLNNMCQIDTMQIEFNSIAWGADIGFTTTPPQSSKKLRK